MNYYVSDLHLFHKNVTNEGTNFDNRPFKTLEEMHELIVKNWNSIITNADHVYLLGDIVWKENEKSIQLVSRLKGNLHAIVGNHDSFKDQRYKRLFVEIVDYKEIQDVVDGKQQWLVLSHYPMASWNHMRKYNRDGNPMKNYAIHLHGHTHNSIEEQAYREYIKMLDEKYNIHCESYNVGAMIQYMNYQPRTLKEIVENNSVK